MEDEFEEHKIDIKLEVQDFHEIEAHDSFDISEDIVADAIKQEELIKSENGDVPGDTMTNKDTMITDPALSVKVEFSVFEETKNVIKLEESDFKDMEMSDSINQDIMAIMPEELIIKSENADSCEENTNPVERFLEVKTSLWSASKSEDDSTTVTNFNCSKKEHDLENHKKQLQHRSATGKAMSGCSTCDQRKAKGGLRAHKLRHNKSAKEIKRLRCGECDYETKQKSRLKRHMLRHKSRTEVELFSCGECSFQTKHKRVLKPHMLRHKSATEIELFSCGQCDYRTKYKQHINSHMLRHKSNTEVEMFSCGECDYRTKYKHHLKRHSLLHKSATEVEMFSCGECNFQTKYKSSLNSHKLVCI